MASAASLIPELKAGKTLARPGYDSVRDSLGMAEEGVTYAKYYGEDEWSYETFTLEEIATWTDEGDWAVEDEGSPPDTVKSASQFFKHKN